MLFRSVITLFLIAQIAHTADEFLARVTANPAQIKADTEVLATVPQGTRLWVFEVRDDRWVKVKVPGEEKKDWLHASQIQRIERSDAATPTSGPPLPSQADSSTYSSSSVRKARKMLNLLTVYRAGQSVERNRIHGGCPSTSIN